MDSMSFQTTSQLEEKLSGLYETLYKKESSVAKKINKFSEKQESQSAKRALFLHIAFNAGAIATLFYLLH